MVANKGPALRKRQQIDSSKKTMFVAVAIAAFVVGVALVVSYFLVRQIQFHMAVHSAKQETLDMIKQNIKNVDELKENVRAMDTNEALSSVKLNDDSRALQSILDALPSEPNVDAFGASLQKVFVGQVDGLRMNNLSVNLSGDAMASSGSSSMSEASASDISAPSIEFQMTVAGSPTSLKELLVRFEKSIRVITIDSIEIQSGESELSMTVRGRTYYMPTREIKIGERIERPKN